MSIWRMDGVTVKKKKPARINGQSFTRVAKIDLDDTEKKTRQFNREIYKPALFEVTDSVDLKRELVEEAHSLETRREGLGPEFLLPQVAYFQGSKISDEELLSAQEKYHRLVVDLEYVASMDGVVEGLLEIQRRFPETALITNTLCPGWLAPLRLRNGPDNLLPFVHGIIAVTPVWPTVEVEQRFPLCVAASRRWLEKLYAQTAADRAHLLLEIELRADVTKPNPYCVQLAMDWAGVGVGQTAVIGDNHLTDQAVALNAGVDNFIHHAGGAAKPPTVPPRWSVQRFDEIPEIFAKMFAA